MVSKNYVSISKVRFSFPSFTTTLVLFPLIHFIELIELQNPVEQ
jgi:hypothetical protein